jgi:methanethiol S-methyltransferase
MMGVTIIERVHSPGGRIPWAWRAFAWLGALLFGASLAYFLFTYAVTFGENQEAPAPLRAIAWNLGLFTVFALHHSVFARERVRAFVARTVPACLERSVYVWVASALLIAVCRWWQPIGGTAWSVAPPLGWLLYGVLATGVWLSVVSARTIDVWDLAGVRHVRASTHRRSQIPNPKSQHPTPKSQDITFHTKGPYGVVRHPIYLGWFLMVFGVPTMTGTRLMFALVSCAYLLIAVPFEERTLRHTTGGRYDEYIRLVRWKLVPWIY